MAKIKELSLMLANQIAAGEVVERPASVVKELVENALDAGATRIDISLEEAGMQSIQVSDDGEGIAADEVLLAFQRHATSKLVTRDDLFRIRTLGFRGEALPSIASVSKLTIETAVANQPGQKMVLHAGQVVQQQAAIARRGTTITVAELFYNTPARLKFVRTLQTELANVTDVVNRLALSHPHVAFTLWHDGNRLLQTSGSGQLPQTLAAIYGPSVARKMLAFETENLDFTVRGWISLPEVTRANRNYISLFVNNRFIKNYALTNALLEGYRSKLMIGRFPVAVVHITSDFLLVDVNVHPTKQQVRISKEKELTQLISQAVHDCLQAAQRIPEGIDGLLASQRRQTSPREQLDLLTADTSATQTTPVARPVADANDWQMPPMATTTPEQPSLVAEPHTPFQPPQANEESTHASEETTQCFNGVDMAEASFEATPAKQAFASRQEGASFPQLFYFGQMHGTYLFAENEKGLYLIDQHAAQERIQYEYYREALTHVADDNQGLLVPIVLDFSAAEYLLLQERLPLLSELGINLQPFGQNSYMVDSHPTWFPKGHEETVIREMVQMALEQGSVSLAALREQTAITMSCKRSIKANHHLDDKQARQLLVDLAHTKNPYNCPHGRPTLIHLSLKDLEKLFKRIQDTHGKRYD